MNSADAGTAVAAWVSAASRDDEPRRCGDGRSAGSQVPTFTGIPPQKRGAASGTTALGAYQARRISSDKGSHFPAFTLRSHPTFTLTGVWEDHYAAGSGTTGHAAAAKSAEAIEQMRRNA
jgi:hypothetical protein